MKEELFIMKGGYMSKKLFNSGIDYETQYKIQTSFPSPEWDWARAHNDSKHTISKSAIELSKKIKKELNIEVFPLIITVAVKGYASSGQMQFMMFGIGNSNEYYFDYPVHKYKLKSSKLIESTDSFDKVITLDE